MVFQACMIPVGETWVSDMSKKSVRFDDGLDDGQKQMKELLFPPTPLTKSSKQMEILLGEMGRIREEYVS